MHQKQSAGYWTDQTRDAHVTRIKDNMIIIPSNAREEYVRLLQSKGKDEACRMLFARLIMSKGRKWWNENKLQIKQELEELEALK